MIDKPGMFGGVCVNTGTIPSKTFREAVLHLTGMSCRVTKQYHHDEEKATS